MKGSKSRMQQEQPSRSAAAVPDGLAVDSAITAATRALLRSQRSDGHWVFELEADSTIPAEYVLLKHYLDEPLDAALEEKFAVYLRRQQGGHGGWPLFYDGDFDMSASVKAYFALKMIGDSPEAPHMVRARQAILSRGGAKHSNVFTRILLALYRVMKWTSVPVMPVEIVLLPRWFPFHLSKVSYWGRTVIVPLLVLRALKPGAKNPRGVTIDELFTENPREIGPPERAPHQGVIWFTLFRGIDAVLRAAEPWFPVSLRRRAIARAVDFVTERLNGEDGLGAIYPAIANSVMMFEALGFPKDHPDAAVARAAVDRLVVMSDREAYCQPCVSPVWDTALACHALLESGDEAAAAGAGRGLQWLLPKQILDVKGDWAAGRPNVRPGGWAFQYANPHYPDLDDTAVVAMAMDRADRGGLTAAPNSHAQAIARAREWIEGLQSMNGAWAAFDADNTTSLTSLSPTTARFSTRQLPMSPPAASPCSPNSARRARRAPFWRGGSTPCLRTRKEMEAGLADGG
jgi:squalene-hopene/tetraprenyl-beta-curcumene cyclase